MGCTSFGGPAAHIGFFQRRFVQELNWLHPDDFANTLALCQFLPGPSSSQLGFAIGYKQAGLAGAAAAFVGFTLPSALLMLLAGLGASWLLTPGPWAAVISMLQLTAVVVVADAVIALFSRYCRTAPLRWLTGLWFVAFLLLPTQLPLLLVAAVLGYLGTGKQALAAPSTGPRIGWLLIAAACALAGLWLSQHGEGASQITAGFVHTGLWVFGGGHVVLPLLQHQFPGLDSGQFLAGYGLAQALPGPLFSFAAYLGTQLYDQPILGALLALMAIFLPGFCLLLGLLNHWQSLSQKPRLQGAIAAVNAAVVALLAAALWQPLISHSLHTWGQLVLAVAGLALLRVARLPVLGLLGLALIAGMVQGFSG